MANIIIDGKTVDQSELNPARHQFIGMFRRPFECPINAVLCSCGAILTYFQLTRDHWAEGHWDICQYKTIDSHKRNLEEK